MGKFCGKSETSIENPKVPSKIQKFRRSWSKFCEKSKSSAELSDFPLKIPGCVPGKKNGMKVQTLRRDADLYFTVCPAALETLSAFAGIVIKHDVQHVFTGSAECCRGCRFARKRDARVAS